MRPATFALLLLAFAPVVAITAIALWFAFFAPTALTFAGLLLLDGAQAQQLAKLVYQLFKKVLRFVAAAALFTAFTEFSICYTTALALFNDALRHMAFLEWPVTDRAATTLALFRY